MSDQNRVQLDTKIEREVHRLVQGISEGAFDKLQVYVRRNNLPIDLDVLTHLLKTMQVVITELEMTQIDTFHSNIKKELDGYTGDSSPTVSPKVVGGKAPVTTTVQMAQPSVLTAPATTATTSKKENQWLSQSKNLVWFFIYCFSFINGDISCLPALNTLLNATAF